MKFKIDQNLAVECAEVLRAGGHDAMTVYDQSLGGAPDDKIADVCRAEQRIVVSADLDFSSIVDFPLASSPGSIVLRLRNQSKASQLAAIGRIIPLLASEQISERLWIVEETRVRIRGG